MTWLFCVCEICIFKDFNGFDPVASRIGYVCERNQIGFTGNGSHVEGFKSLNETVLWVLMFFSMIFCVMGYTVHTWIVMMSILNRFIKVTVYVILDLLYLTTFYLKLMVTKSYLNWFAFYQN